MELNQNTLSRGSSNDTGILVERETTFAGTIKTSYLRTGYGSPVIFLHGGGAGAVAWYHVIKDLSKFIFAIAPDLVGYGESDKPYASYDRHFFSQWLKDFTDTLGLETCVLVGHSLGGAIALQFALDHPERVRRLVLVCSAGLGLSLPFVPLLKGLLLYSFPSKMTSRYLHAGLVYRPENLDEEFIEYAKEVCQKPGGKRAFWRGCGRAVFPIRFGELRKIVQPTRLIWGAEDRVFPLSHARRAIRMIPNAHLHVIPQAAHIPFFDQPKVFHNVLLKSLEDPC